MGAQGRDIAARPAGACCERGIWRSTSGWRQLGGRYLSATVRRFGGRGIDGAGGVYDSLRSPLIVRGAITNTVQSTPTAGRQARGQTSSSAVSRRRRASAVRSRRPRAEPHCLLLRPRRRSGMALDSAGCVAKTDAAVARADTEARGGERRPRLAAAAGIGVAASSRPRAARPHEGAEVRFESRWHGDGRGRTESNARATRPMLARIAAERWACRCRRSP